MTKLPTDLFDEWYPLPSANEEEIGRIENQMGLRLPDDFKEWLLQSNGGQGRIGEHYLTIWGTHEMIDKNRLYKITTELPGIIGFADNGPEIFGFDTLKGGS